MAVSNVAPRAFARQEDLHFALGALHNRHGEPVAPQLRLCSGHSWNPDEASSVATLVSETPRCKRAVRGQRSLAEPAVHLDKLALLEALGLRVCGDAGERHRCADGSLLCHRVAEEQDADDDDDHALHSPSSQHPPDYSIPGDRPVAGEAR